MNRPTPRLLGRVLALVLLMGAASAVASDRGKPLHVRIDEVIDAARVGPEVPLAGDAEYLRRLSLDLIGMPPSIDELRGFIADQDPAKRARAVDRLLNHPLHARHLATMLDVMLMERRPSLHVPEADWFQYLLTACRENRPLNGLFREILAADGLDPKLRPAARFYLDRGAEPNLITRDVGRVFLGRDLQCAHCHDHPLIEDYRQADYQGLLAFFTPSYELIRKEAGKDVAYFAEKAGGDLAFDSVFVKNDKHLTRARLQGGAELAEPEYPPGQEYKVAPAEGVAPVPKHSRRLQLAALATEGGNEAFNENLANRLWAMMMGRGLVHPLDLAHPANPPSHPELLRVLASELVTLKFDAKAFLRELALSRAYQRAIDLPADPGDHPGEAVSSLDELKSRTDSLTNAAEAAQEAYKQAVGAWNAAESALVPAATAQDQAYGKYAAAAKKQSDAQKALDAHLALIKAREDVGRVLAEAAAKGQEAAKKLPAEKDLAAAAEKFLTRSKAIATEAQSLEKATAGKADGVKKAAAEVTPTVTAVEAARALARPLREAVVRKERTTLAARRAMAQARVALEVHKRRIDLLEAWIARESIEAKIAAANRSTLDCRSKLGQSETRSLALVASINARRAELKAAEQARLTAKSASDTAQAALDRSNQILASVDAAFKATDSARGLLPGDPTLTTAASQLKSRADELRAGAKTLQTKLDAALNALKPPTDQVTLAARAVEAAIAERTRHANEVDAARKSLAELESRSKALATELISAREQLATLLGDDFQLGQLKPLTPEQLFWSILKTTGVYDRTRAAEESALNKAKPSAGKDPALVRAREIEIEQLTFDKLKGNLASFVRVYAAGAGQPQGDFFATPDQALFASNGGLVNSWIAPAPGNVSDRMIHEPDPTKAARELYLTLLSRPPSADETAEVAAALASPAIARPAAVQEFVWGLLTSAEFRFNH